MSAATLCPNLQQPCEDCIADFIWEHPGVDVWRHTYHICDCPWVATPADGGEDTCVGCSTQRDLALEFAHIMRGAA